MTVATPAAYDPTEKQKAQAKLARIPVKVVNDGQPALKKPDWIRVKAASPTSRFYEIKRILRENHLHTVCEEASCPNIGECFGQGTATFMIMGDKCTRRCPFCDVGHGRPDALDADEPLNLAKTIAALKLQYVVITSVDRDDLRDGGAAHFVACIQRVRELSNGEIEWTDGMLYPVLHWLEEERYVKTRWEMSEAGRKRKYYSLRADGRKHLASHVAQWTVVHNALRRAWRIKHV